MLEIFVESLPARFLPLALAQLQERSAQRLKEARLEFSELRVFGTPMRLAVWIGGLGAKSRPESREAAGPPARLWKDPDGRLSKQAAGFARAQGVAPEELVLRSGPKGEYLAAVKQIPGEPAQAVLARVWGEE
ncbi:MAG: glycine--tRNA ligase subunit beta [Chloroflexota bacterium]